MLEREIEGKVRQYGIDIGYMCYKFESPGNAGVPDRIFINPLGLTVYIEFKQYGKLPTDNQARQISKLLRQRAPVFVVDNVESGKKILAQWLHRIDTTT